MIGSLNPFFDRSIVLLCFRHMVLSVCEIHIHIKVVIDPLHHTAKLSVAVNFFNHKSGLVVVPENLVEGTIVLFVLSGIHWDQTSELDCPINCSKHTTFIHIHSVHAQLDVVMFLDKLFGDFNEICSH
jgi:hypothetical protein